jgi:hypothetical protein
MDRARSLLLLSSSCRSIPLPVIVRSGREMEIRATVAPAPYVDFARTAYRAG